MASLRGVGSGQGCGEGNGGGGGGKEEADVATVACSFQIWPGAGCPAARVGYFDLSFLSKKCLHGSVGYSTQNCFYSHGFNSS